MAGGGYTKSKLENRYKNQFSIMRVWKNVGEHMKKMSEAKQTADSIFMPAKRSISQATGHNNSNNNKN